MTKEIARLMEVAEGLGAQLNGAKEANTSLRGEAEAEVALLQSELAGGQQEITRLQNLLVDWQTAYDRAEAGYNGVLGERDHKLNEVLNELDKTRESLEGLRTQKPTDTTDVDSLRVQLQYKEYEFGLTMSAHEGTINELQEKVTELEAQVTKLTADTKAANTQRNKFYKDMTAAKEQLKAQKELETSLEEVKEKLKKEENKVAKLYDGSELQARTEERDELEAED